MQYPYLHIIKGASNETLVSIRSAILKEQQERYDDFDILTHGLIGGQELTFIV